MSRVVVDNWTIASAMECMSQENEIIVNQSYANMIEAIILWDDICYFENEKTVSWKSEMSDLGYEDVLKKIDFPDIDCNKIISKFSCSPQSFAERSALEYVAMCNHIDVDYIAFQKRADYLNNLYTNRIKEVHKAAVDKKLDVYYENEAQMDSKPFRFPALFDYVRRTTSNSDNYIQTAVQLKASTEVREYRHWIDEIANEGNVAKRAKLMKDADRIIAKVGTIEKTITIPTVNVRIMWNYLAGIFSVEGEFKEHKIRITNRSPLVFLQDLLDTNMNERPVNSRINI